MDKIVRIDDKDVKFRASALTPRLYRHIFGRDFLVDINKLRSSFTKITKTGDESTLEIIDLEIFENIAYTMAKQGDPNIPADPGEWLDQFDTFSVYYVLPEIMELWAMNEATTSVPKKG